MEERKFNLFLAFFAGIGMGASILIIITILNLQYTLLSFEFRNEGPIGFMEDVYYNYQISKYQHDMRNFTINIVRDCIDDLDLYKKGTYHMCYLDKVYKYIKKNVKYISVEDGVIYPPMYTIGTGVADCKNYIVTVCSMLRSVGVTCYWKLDLEEGHVYNLVYIEHKGTFKMDLSRYPTELVLIDE